MESKVYGYVRVSSKDQNEDRQVLAMRQFGIPDEQIFIEKSLVQSLEEDVCRPCFNELLSYCRKSESFKSEYHISHPRIELSETACNQYADNIWTIMTTMLKHCDSKGYDVNTVMAL